MKQMPPSPSPLVGIISATPHVLAPQREPHGDTSPRTWMYALWRYEELKGGGSNAPPGPLSSDPNQSKSHRCSALPVNLTAPSCPSLSVLQYPRAGGLPTAGYAHRSARSRLNSSPREHDRASQRIRGGTLVFRKVLPLGAIA